MTPPRIHLAIDNCFASKRWTHPSEWAPVVRDLGIAYVEASADNECDPLYTTPAYLDDWVRDVRSAGDNTGVRVVNLYSGHGTYATLGLAHTDRRIRDHILNDWLKVMARTAARLGAGLGFFTHAFCESVLQDPARYRAAEEDLYDRLAELAAHAHQCGTTSVGVEQMYTPHQIPWTLDGADRLLREVLARRGHPLYLTIDTGHQTGQRRFLRPRREQIAEALRQVQSGKTPEGLWLGPRAAYALFDEAVAAAESAHGACLERIEAQMDRFPYLFARHDDGDLYAWLERFACYSPIIHLQQTDGTCSSHLPFTEPHNRHGIVEPARVLQAIAASYAHEAQPGLPPPCENLYLTIEIFSATADLSRDIIRRLEQSVAYWRTHVPRDGLRLDEIVDIGASRRAPPSETVQEPD